MKYDLQDYVNAKKEIIKFLQLINKNEGGNKKKLRILQMRVKKKKNHYMLKN